MNITKKYNTLTLLLCSILTVPGIAETVDNKKVALGKLIFHDTNLSEPKGQACNSCHDSKKFYTDPDKMVSPGANPELFGNRNAPMISYVKFNPDLYWDKEEEHWVGGFFLDGRAKTKLDQAAGPFLNPLEMGNPNEETVVLKVKQSDYAALVENIYGKDIWMDAEKAFFAIRDAIVHYELGDEFAPFTSKYDYYLRGKVQLSDIEKKGLELFESEEKGNCAACHTSQLGNDGKLPLLTDFTYDNLGLPAATELPFLNMSVEYNPDGKKYADSGLKQNPHIHNSNNEIGKFKVPTLRNIANSAPYMHNGMFSSLKEVVDFYNTRDIDEKWGKPEIKENVNTDELGDLGLTDEEVDAIIAFLKTLSDGYKI